MYVISKGKGDIHDEQSEMRHNKYWEDDENITHLPQIWRKIFMSLGWIKPEKYPFNCILLMERFQLRYVLDVRCGENDELARAMGIALAGNPAVAWYVKHRCPECLHIVDALVADAPKSVLADELRRAEVDVLASMEDFAIYTTPHKMIDGCDFIRGWNKGRLFELTDFEGKTVLDIGAGSGRLAFAASEKAAMVYAVEPVGTLREFMRDEIVRLGITNIRILDGFVENLPYPDDMFDIVMSGHVVGDDYDTELAETERVTKPGGWILNVPGDSERDIKPNKELTSRGFEEIHYVGSFGYDVHMHRKQVMKLIHSKDGVHVYKCTHNGRPAVLKRFEKDEYRREIANYRILMENDVPTIEVYELGESSIIMEDIDFSEEWRLGVAQDLQDIDVAKGLAAWYFDFHEKGCAIPALNDYYCEYDKVAVANIEALCARLPEADEVFRYILDNFGRLREIIDGLDYTLTYNDFYWTNFVVGKDRQGKSKRAAKMFDYNFLGRGFRYADIRNVCSSLSDEAAAVFVKEYSRLYIDRHGSDRTAKEHREKQVDRVVSTLFTLIAAFEHEKFPRWADEERDAALNGTLLDAARELLK